MAKIKAKVIDATGKSTGERDLPEAFFGADVNVPVMHQVVVAQLAGARSGTASTKTRSEVRGGGKKPWRQKGTGRARQGSIRSPQWRGGGSVFGPRANRNFKQDVPKQVKWLARRSAYNVRAQDGGIFLLDSIQLDAPKTKAVVALLAAAGVAPNAGLNVLVLTDGHKPVVHRSARNIPGVQVRPFGQESAYDLLWADTLIIEAPALERAQEVAHA